MELSQRNIKYLADIEENISSLVQDHNVSLEDKLEILASVGHKIEQHVYGLAGDMGKV